MTTISGTNRAERERDAWRADHIPGYERGGTGDAVSPSAPDPVAPTATETLRDTYSPLERFRDERSRAEVLAQGPVAAPVAAPAPAIAFFGSPTEASVEPDVSAPTVDARFGPHAPIGVVPLEQRPDGEPSADRRAEIDAWVEDNAHATRNVPLVGWSVDAEGGERVVEAYAGDSSLGTLSAAETSYLATRALAAWQETGNEENVRQSVDGVDDASTRALIATAYATPAADQTRAVRESDVVTTTTAEARRVDALALELAVALDPVATVAAFEGVEGELGDLVGRLPGHTGHVLSETLLAAVADGRLDASSDAISRMTTALFLRSRPNDFIYDNAYRETTARALAEIMADPADFAGLSDPHGAYRAGVARLAERYDNILARSDSGRLLTDERVVPALRGWAVAEIAANPAWTPEALRDGWESDVVSETFARPVIDRYRARGTDPQELGGEALRNTIGQALGFPPDLLPPADESDAAAEARLAAGFDHAYYGENARIDALAARIEQLGGLEAEVTIMPVVVTSAEFGAATFNVFRVEGLDGKTHFVEDVDPNRHYTGFDDWQSNSQLPPGQMTYAENLDWSGGDAALTTESTALVTDTFGEWARKIGDGAALVVGVGAGVLIVVGSGGTALFVAAGAAGLYTTARGVEELADAHAHGEDITDLSDAEIRSRWLDVASGALSFGAIGSARGALQLTAGGSRLAPAARTAAAALQLGANGADLVAAGNQARDLALNWDELDAGQRAMGLLNVAFWGGMTAASGRAGGGSLIDGYSFTRLRNNIEFGTPYALSRNEALAPGEMRVVYERGGDGRATGISIEYGGASADPAMLALHTRAARQVELSGGLLDELRLLSGGEARGPVGSAAWEARIELRKIAGEATDIGHQLSDPGLAPAERAGLELRLDELEAASASQAERLGSHAVDGGEGWIASPSRGTVQAASLGWPDAPDGHVWVAGSGEPHLRRVDAEGDKLYYDPATALFTDTPSGSADARRIGHGDNEVTWTESADGRSVSVRALLREFHAGAGRTADELAAQAVARARGIDGDHAGHIVGHRFVLDEGLRNLFPQDANLNTGAYKTLENELADWIAAGADVRLDVELGGIVDGRPETIDVSYTVTDPSTGREVYANMDSFDNAAGQSFERIESSRITPELVDPRLPTAPGGVR